MGPCKVITLSGFHFTFTTTFSTLTEIKMHIKMSTTTNIRMLTFRAVAIKQKRLKISSATNATDSTNMEYKLECLLTNMCQQE